MNKQKSPPGKIIDYKSNRKRILEIAFVCSLIMLSALFYSFKKFDHSNIIIPPKPESMESIIIPKTRQPEKIVRPALPRIPVPADDDDFCEDVTISNYKDIDVASLLAGSGPPENDIEGGIPFVECSEKPVLITRVTPAYPELARKSHIEGSVVTKVLIDKKGNIEVAEIFKSVPMLDDAALKAVRQFKFKPGKQRDKYVKVWMHIPFAFRLK